MPSLHYTVLMLSLLLSALITGLFYSYSCSVNPGLGRLPDREYLQAMQLINSAIQNPAFFISFIGTVVMLPLASWLSYRQHSAFATGCLLAASLIYIIGVFGVTAAGNVPLNKGLATFDIYTASAQELRVQRLKFERPWNLFHAIRTACCVLAFLLTSMAALKR